MGLGSVIANRGTRFPFGPALALGALINTPGLMVLILLNMGLDLGVIPKELFAVLVGSAMLRNLATTPLLRRARAAGLPADGAEAA